MTTLTETRLPAIFLECCDDLTPALARPWIDPNRWICASDGRIVVRAKASRLDWMATVGLPVAHSHVPPVGHYFNRWKPDGRTLILPPGRKAHVRCPRCDARPRRMATCLECEGEGFVSNRERVRLAHDIDLAAYRVAMLLEHGVREVRAGVGPRAPVRFEVGAVEGLLMPLREMVR